MSSLDFCLSSPTSEKTCSQEPLKHVIVDEENQSMTEMDPAMASLTQSLEELDRDLDDPLHNARANIRSGKTRLSLGGSHHGSPVIRKTGPGSVPLLASTEDISVVGTVQKPAAVSKPQVLPKAVNPDSYSTVV